VRGRLLISVIVPSFNRPRQAQSAITSAMRQRDVDSRDVEIVAVDDASSPPLRLSDTAPNVRVVRLAVNVGPAGARNAGVAASRGEYLAFLDSDDRWLPEKLSRQLETFKAIRAQHDGAPVAVVCGFYSPNTLTGRLEARMPRGATRPGEFVAGCWYSPGSTLLVHRSTFERVGGFDERLRRLEDFDWFIRFGQLGGQLHVCDVFGAVVPPSSGAAYEDVMLASRIIAEKTADLAHKLTTADKRKFAAYLEVCCGVTAFSERRPARALRHLIRSFLLSPRTRAQTGDFSPRSRVVPIDVKEAWNEMMAEAA
jgi:glycosyltransferase involved in cell wall biosynthesis